MMQHHPVARENGRRGRLGFFLFFVFFLILAFGAYGSYTQTGGDLGNSRIAPNVIARDPSNTLVKTLCDVTKRDFVSAGEPLVQNMENDTLIFMPVYNNSKKQSGIMKYDISFTTSNTCTYSFFSIDQPTGATNNTFLSIDSFRYFQPALTMRGIMPQLVYPVYAWPNGDQGNLSIFVVNVTTSSGILEFDRVIVLNHTNHRAEGAWDNHIGTSAAIKCDGDACLLFSNDLPLFCGINLTSKKYDCNGAYANNLARGNYSGPGPSQFVVWQNLSSSYYAIAQLTNFTAYWEWPWIAVSWQYYPGINFLVSNVLFNNTGFLTLQPGTDAGGFVYLASQPVIIRYNQSMLNPDDQVSVAFAYSHDCFSSSGECAGSSNLSNTSMNHVVVYRALTGKKQLEFTTAEACSPDPANWSLIQQYEEVYLPRVGEAMVVQSSLPSMNTSWLCIPMTTPDAFNVSLNSDGETLGCFLDDKSNIAGIQCYNLTPVMLGPGLYDVNSVGGSAWPYTFLSSAEFNSSLGMWGSVRANKAVQSVYGPHFSPFSLRPRQRRSYNTTLSGVWALYPGSQPDPAKLATGVLTCLQFGAGCGFLDYPGQNSTSYYFDGAEFTSPYDSAAGQHMADWVDQSLVPGCLSNAAGQDFSIGTEKPQFRPEWSASPYTIDGEGTRTYTCDVDRTYPPLAKDYWLVSDPSSSQTVATDTPIFPSYPIVVTQSDLYLQGAELFELRANAYFPKNHTGVGMSSARWDTNISNLCENQTVTFEVTKGGQETNDAWYALADCGQEYASGTYTRNLTSNVSCTFGRAGVYSGGLYTQDRFSLVPNTRGTHLVIAVTVTGGAACQNAGSGGMTVQNATNNVMPNFGTVSRSRLSTTCFNQPVNFSVTGYANPEGYDYLQACLQVHTVTADVTKDTGLFDYLNYSECAMSQVFTVMGFGSTPTCNSLGRDDFMIKASRPVTFLINQTICGSMVRNGSVLSVAFVPSVSLFNMPGRWNISMYITDNAHVNITSVHTRDYQYNVQPFFCYSDGSCDAECSLDYAGNESIGSPGGESGNIRANIQAALWGLGFQGTSSRIMIYMVIAAVIAGSMFALRVKLGELPFFVDGIVQGCWFVLAVALGILPLYFLFIILALPLIGGFAWYFVSRGGE